MLSRVTPGLGHDVLVAFRRHRDHDAVANFDLLDLGGQAAEKDGEQDPYFRPKIALSLNLCVSKIEAFRIAPLRDTNHGTRLGLVCKRRYFTNMPMETRHFMAREIASIDLAKSRL